MGSREISDDTIKIVQEKAKEIDARPDEPYRKADIDGEEKTVITKNQYDGAMMVDELYSK